MSQTIPVTKARSQLLKLVDKIHDEYTRVDLTKKGEIKASLVSPDYLDSLEETIYSLENSMEDIKKAEKEYKKGEYVELDEFLKELNADKNTRRNKKG